MCRVLDLSYLASIHLVVVVVLASQAACARRANQSTDELKTCLHMMAQVHTKQAHDAGTHVQQEVSRHILKCSQVFSIACTSTRLHRSNGFRPHTHVGGQKTKGTQVRSARPMRDSGSLFVFNKNMFNHEWHTPIVSCSTASSSWHLAFHRFRPHLPPPHRHRHRLLPPPPPHHHPRPPHRHRLDPLPT